MGEADGATAGAGIGIGATAAGAEGAAAAAMPAYGTGTWVTGTTGTSGAPTSTTRSRRRFTSRTLPRCPDSASSQRCQASGSMTRYAYPSRSGARRAPSGMGVRRNRDMATWDPNPAASRRAYSTG